MSYLSAVVDLVDMIREHCPDQYNEVEKAIIELYGKGVVSEGYASKVLSLQRVETRGKARQRHDEEQP